MKKNNGNLTSLLAVLFVLGVGGVSGQSAQGLPIDDVAVPHPIPSSSYWVERLPAGDNRDLVVSRCQMCHTLQRVVAFSRSREQWKNLVDEMLFSKATSPFYNVKVDVKGDEASKIADYLARNFGRAATHPPASPSDCPVQTNGSSTFRNSLRGQYSLWVSNEKGASVDIVDPAKNKVIERIKCISSPEAVVFSPDGSRAYITDRVEYDVAVLDTNTGRILKKVPLSNRPNWAILTKNGKQLIVGIWQLQPNDASQGSIEIIDTDSLRVVKIIPTKGGVHDLWMSPDGKYFTAGSIMGDFLNAYETKTDKLVWEMKFQHYIALQLIDAKPDGSTNRVFVSNGGPGFHVIDFATHKIMSDVWFPNIKHHVNGGITDLYVSSHRGELASWHGSDITPDGKSMWFAGQAAEAENNLYGYSLPDLKSLGYVHLSDVDPLGNPRRDKTQPHNLSISPDGQKIYVIEHNNDIMAVADVKLMKEIAVVPVGEGPQHVVTFVHPQRWVTQAGKTVVP